MTCTHINLSLFIKENATRIMFTIYLGTYFQGQTQLSIASFKWQIMFGTQEQKSYQKKSFITLLISTITW